MEVDAETSKDGGTNETDSEENVTSTEYLDENLAEQMGDQIRDIYDEVGDDSTTKNANVTNVNNENDVTIESSNKVNAKNRKTSDKDNDSDMETNSDKDGSKSSKESDESDSEKGNGLESLSDADMAEEGAKQVRI